jgi:hypothetical protein
MFDKTAARGWHLRAASILRPAVVQPPWSWSWRKLLFGVRGFQPLQRAEPDPATWTGN